MPPEPFDLDAQATSPLLPAAFAAMRPLLEGQHWNPHSAHRGGRIAKAALEAARAQVAARLGLGGGRLLFTSGATEANNLALKGALEARPGRLVTFATEHSCVLEAARHLDRRGVPVTILPVGADGMPDLAAYRAALGPDVALVSAMAINNEIGSRWPIAELAEAAQAVGALVHCDAAQAFGKVELGGCGADLVSLSAHKMHGPKGIGALWVRDGVALAPLLDGGGQEGGVRSGTQSPALAAGFGAAAAAADPATAQAHCRHLMAIALDALARVPHRVNGPGPLGPDRWPGNLSVTFPGVDAGRLVARLPHLALASGAACSSGSGRPSHVLAAIGVPPALARQTLRLGWHGLTDEAGFRAALSDLVAAALELGARAA
ncbi:MAG: cysteine desulfurase family protein [Sphingomonadaceae bacterium]